MSLEPVEHVVQDRLAAYVVLLVLADAEQDVLVLRSKTLSSISHCQGTKNQSLVTDGRGSDSRPDTA